MKTQASYPLVRILQDLAEESLFGFNLFYIRGVAPPSVSMMDIYRVLWLPDLLLR